MNWKVVLAIMTCNVVLMSASYTMLIPFLPLYLSNDLGVEQDHLNLWTGAIFAVSFAVCAIMAPIWGKMSDSRGKKLMLLRSSSMIALSYFLGAIVQTPMQLFLVRAFQGFAAGLWPASLALTSAYTPSNKVGISMGVMQSANICGGIIGPLFGGVLAEYFGIRNSFIIAGIALMIITIVTLIFIKEPPKTEHQKAAKPTSYKELLSREGVVMILIIGGLANMVIMLLQPILTLYVRELRGTEENLIMISGLVFSLSGFAGAVASPIWGRKGQALGFYKTLVTALIAAGILIALQYIPNSLVPFAILQFCVGLGFSGIFPSANSMAINITSPIERGTIFGMTFSAQQVGGTVGPILGGLIGTYINLATVFFISGCTLICIAILVVLKAPPALKNPPSQASRDTRAHDAIVEIKEKVAEELASQLAAEKAAAESVHAHHAHANAEHLAAAAPSAATGASSSAAATTAATAAVAASAAADDAVVKDKA